eukprot:1890042-Pleurochrysis_carterae.AAC.1
MSGPWSGQNSAPWAARFLPGATVSCGLEARLPNLCDSAPCRPRPPQLPPHRSEPRGKRGSASVCPP